MANAASPLTRVGVGWALHYLRGIFNAQPQTLEQARQDRAEGINKATERNRVRGRRYSFPKRCFQNRTLGMVLLTFGFDVPLIVLAEAYTRAKADAAR